MVRVRVRVGVRVRVRVSVGVRVRVRVRVRARVRVRLRVSCGGRMQLGPSSRKKRAAYAAGDRGVNVLRNAGGRELAQC